MTDTFLLKRAGDVAIYYIPFERVNPDARVILIGITPGFTQMQLAYETARDAVAAGLPFEQVLRRVDEQQVSPAR